MSRHTMRRKLANVRETKVNILRAPCETKPLVAARRQEDPAPNEEDALRAHYLNRDIFSGL